MLMLTKPQLRKEMAKINLEEATKILETMNYLSNYVDKYNKIFVDQLKEEKVRMKILSIPVGKETSLYDRLVDDCKRRYHKNQEMITDALIIRDSEMFDDYHIIINRKEINLKDAIEKLDIAVLSGMSTVEISKNDLDMMAIWCTEVEKHIELLKGKYK